MRALSLYSAIKTKILQQWPQQYITQGFVDYQKDNDLAIFIKDIGPLKAYVANRKYNGRIATCQFIFQATQSDEDFYENRTFCSALEEYILQIQNEILHTDNHFSIDNNGNIIHIDTPTEEDHGIEVFIRSTDLINSIAALGKSPDGRPMFSINFSFQYYIGGKV